MAKVSGEFGRYVSDEEAAKFRYFLLAVFSAVALDAFLVGIFLAQEFSGRRTALFISGLPVAATGIVLWFLFVAADWKLKKFEQKRLEFLKGPAGEVVVAHRLTELPDDYVVLNNLATLHGTLDHVVIGPTGVYVIETCAGRGWITADGQGDILINGKSPERPVVRLLLHRILNVRDQVALLCSGKPPAGELPLFKGVMVFPAACVEARLGSTGSAFCLDENQVCDFILRNKWNDELDAAQVKRLVRAFRSLAKVDKESLPITPTTIHPSQPPPPNSPQSVFIS